MFNTPILLITFNRPSHTRKVWEAIKEQHPKQVYVFQDGSRDGNELDVEKCKAVRAIFEEQIDFACELHTFYSDKNLGCGHGPSSAITWFFKHVEQGIILEDDCLPHKDFYEYCEQLLEEYKDNEQISFIAGSSFQNQSNIYPLSYYYGCGSYGTWGWATWKRAWDNFDYYIGSFDVRLMSKIIKHYFKESRQQNFWMEVYENVKNDRYNESCWDYQFYFSCWKKNMLAIIPYTNMISNIGYDIHGTHTFSENHPAANLITKSILPLKHPDLIQLNIKADFFVHRYYTIPYEYGFTGFKRIFFRINKKIKRIVGIQGSWIKR